MKRLLELPLIRQLHQRRLLFPTLLGLSVVAILIQGALTQKVPSLNPPKLDLPLSAFSVPSLRPSLEKSPLTYHSDYWWQLAEAVEDKIVLIGPNKRPGVMVAPGVALSSIAAASEFEAEFHPLPQSGEALTGSEQPELVTPPIRLLGVDTDHELAAFAVKQPAGLGNFSQTDVAELQPGSYVVAISRRPSEQVQVIPGYVASVDLASGEHSSSIDFALPFPETSDTAAIVDLDGDLVGLSIKTGSGRTFLSAEVIPQIVADLVAGGFCQAIEVAEIGEDARELLGVREGVFVERVRAEAFFPAPSIREGDILVSWNRQPVRTEGEYQVLYREPEPGDLVRYRVIRNRRTIAGSTRMPGPDCRPAGPGLRLYPRLGMSLEWEDGSWRVVRIIPESAAEGAGIETGDLIVSVGGRDFNRLDARPFERYERNPAPVIFTIRHQERMKIALVGPAEPMPTTP